MAGTSGPRPAWPRNATSSVHRVERRDHSLVHSERRTWGRVTRPAPVVVGVVRGREVSAAVALRLADLLVDVPGRCQSRGAWVKQGWFSCWLPLMAREAD